MLSECFSFALEISGICALEIAISPYATYSQKKERIKFDVYASFITTILKNNQMMESISYWSRFSVGAKLGEFVE